MKYLTLSIKNVEDLSRKLAELVIKSEFKPTSVIYIKNGGYLIGKNIGDNLNIPYSGFKLSRKGNNVKNKLRFIIRILPKCVKNLLRKFEIKSSMYKKMPERIASDYDNLKVVGKNILLVDDSVDTGHTILAAKEFLKNRYGKDINIKVCSINVFSESEGMVKTDYYLYKDMIINYPWSNDSKYLKEFQKIYK